jgi:hypothetical protein
MIVVISTFQVCPHMREHALHPPHFPHADASLTFVQILLHTQAMGQKLMYLRGVDEPLTRRPLKAVTLFDDITWSAWLQAVALLAGVEAAWGRVVAFMLTGESGAQSFTTGETWM